MIAFVWYGYIMPFTAILLLNSHSFYIYFFASSWGPCAWVVTGEIFPLKACFKEKGKSLSKYF